MTKLRAWIVTAVITSLWACGSPEQATVDQFFRAAQTSDSTTIAMMSAVGPPGKVESWKVVEVTSRKTEPYTLPELVAKLAETKKTRDAGQEVRTKYFNDNKDALEEIIPKVRKDPEYKFKGKLGEIQAEWEKMLAERNEQEGAYQELKRIVDKETGIATKSVMRQVDLGTLHGAVAVTEMLLNVKPPDRGELPFRVQLRKYDLSEPESSRVEPARWVIVDIEGTTEEARAAASASQTRPGSSPPAAAAEPAAAPAAEPAKVAESESAEESEPSSDNDRGYVPRELRGVAKVQILAPETKVQGDEVVSTIRVRNVSKDWITGLTVTEHWYDKEGTAVRSSSQTHRDRFMPGEVIELQLKTRKSQDFYQSQYEFKHTNGKVNATTVASFPKAM